MEAGKRETLELKTVRNIVEARGMYSTPKLAKMLVLAYRLGRLHGSRRRRKS